MKKESGEVNMISAYKNSVNRDGGWGSLTIGMNKQSFRHHFSLILCSSSNFLVTNSAFQNPGIEN